ncbi:hypothetical protein [Pseudomonas sp. UBA7530]|uniref:hypothetical protein n=1 Tax=Pseudomonas sp. UBA7530 TaxID=1947341 RepID=UPI0025F35CD2|nr:hypothetical protein [Pseudomonas sp. UBA7530]
MTIDDLFKGIGLEIVDGNGRARALLQIGHEITATDGKGANYVIAIKNGQLSCTAVEKGQCPAPPMLIVRPAQD